MICGANQNLFMWSQAAENNWKSGGANLRWINFPKVESKRESMLCLVPKAGEANTCSQRAKGAE